MQACILIMYIDAVIIVHGGLNLQWINIDGVDNEGK